MKFILIYLFLFGITLSFASAQTDDGFKFILSSIKNNELIYYLESKDKILEVCPRPEKSLTNLEANETNILGFASIIVYDLLGNKLYSEDSFFKEGICANIDLKGLAKGIYFLHISNRSDSITRKIILS